MTSHARYRHDGDVIIMSWEAKVERVARAIAYDDGCDYLEFRAEFEKYARSALKEMMLIEREEVRVQPPAELTGIVLATPTEAQS